MRLDECGMTALNERPRLERTRRNAWFVAALVFVTAVAAAARLYQLERPSFWGDELRTVRASIMPIADMHTGPRAVGQVPTMLGLRASGLDLSRVDPDRPDTWRAFGINEWNARIGSCIVGILTVPILVLAAVRLLGAPASLLAGLLFALAPWHVLWSQAARFYTLQFLFYTLCLIWYFQWRRDRSKRLVVAAVVALVLAFLAQPTSLLALAVIGADIAIGLVRREIAITRREAATLAAGGGACLAILAYYITSQSDTWSRFIAFTGDRPYHQPASLLAGTLYMVQFPIVAIAGLSALWLFRRDRQLATFLAIAAAAPLIILSFWSLWNFVGLRYAIITLWWFLALAAVGLVALYRAIKQHHGRILALAPAAIVVVALVVPLYAYYEDGYGYRARWREAFDHALRHRLPDEKIATTFNQLHVAQYYCGEEDVRIMHWTLDEMIDEFDSPTWLVFHAQTSVRGTEQEWARDGAELRAVFDLRVPQPIEKVGVYRFVPGLAEARKRGLIGAEMSAKSE